MGVCVRERGENVCVCLRGCEIDSERMDEREILCVWKRERDEKKWRERVREEYEDRSIDQ